MFKFKSISAKLNFILFVTVTIVLSISSIYTYNQYSSQIQKDLDNELNRINKRLELVLPSIIWNLQINLVNEIIKTEANSEIIDSIEVFDIDKTILTSVVKNKHILNLYKNADIKYENEKIATLKIYYNKNKIHEAKEYIINSLIIKVVFILLVLQLIFSYFVNKFIINNITKLKNSIIEMTEKKTFIDDIQINSNDELHYLALEFNKMRNQLKLSWQELHVLNKNLENKVSEEVLKNNEIQKQLFKSEKMASMGEMIGNIAHQWRQPLSVISVLATGIKLRQEMGMITPQFIDESCDNINTNTQYLSKTIDDFKNFLQGDKVKSRFDLKSQINSFLNIIKSSATQNNVHINIDINDSIYVVGFENELTQCIINIYNNAKDALLENDVEYKLFNITVQEDKEHVKIILQDNAKGIPSHVLPKIFEPYFTTKHQSQGTGLGLHMTYKIIVDGMNGNIEATNNEFTFEDNTFIGACFTILLPKDKSK
jgi:signal transduction histidine kinase